MKICIVTDYYPPHIGGAEFVVKNLAEGLSKRGIKCLVITSKFSRHLPRVEEVNNVRIIRVTVFPFITRFWFLLFAIPKIIFNAGDYDIIHGTTYGGVIPAYIGSKLLSKKVLLTVHELMGKQWTQFSSNLASSYFYRFAEKIYTRLPFDMFAAVSQYTVETLMGFGVPLEKIRLIYNGPGQELSAPNKSKIQIRKELKIDRNDYIFLAYGRTGLSKGFNYLVDAIPAVLTNIENSIFILILTKENQNNWKYVTGCLNKINSTKIKFFTKLNRINLTNYLSISDCIVIPSLSEGFGFTTIEACSLNKVVVATSAGSIPEIIYGKHVLVDPGDSNALVQGCIKAYAEEFKYNKPKLFNWNVAIDNYIKLYEEILKND